MPEQTLTATCGLVARGGVPVPLASVSVAADVRALCAHVTVMQRYVNAEAQPIEAVYLFPLDEGAAVCGFEALVDGVRIVGEVKEREEAFEMYDEAMSQGHGAFLLDEERPDVFQASLGNLRPGARVDVSLTYVTELEAADGAVRFTVPTTVAPRYAPAQDQRGLGRPEADTLNPPRALAVPYGLDLSVRLATPRMPSRVSSPSHPIDVSFGDGAVQVALSQQQCALDRDFVLTIEGAGFDVPTSWTETAADGESAIAVSFVPRLPSGARPADVIFVVDRSGSMMGTSIAEVRNALHLCLRSMVPGCRFDIVGFGSRVERLFGRSQAYDDESLAKADAHVKAMDADLGGTEILAPLAEVFREPATEGLAREVVVLTDGEVTNTDQVLALVRAHATSHRVFTVGIGAGASAHLVRGMARAGGGTAEFIAPGERIEAKVLRLFARLLSPALTGLAIDWGGLEVVQAPSTVPPAFTGERLVVYGFAKAMKAATVRLTGTGPAGHVAFEVPVAGTGIPGRVIATLAARARIRELEESPAWLHARGLRQDRRRPSATVREVVDLGVRHGLVSRETSYVAIERRERPVEGELQLRRVPIAITAGWGGMASDAARRQVSGLVPDTMAMPRMPAAMAASDVMFSRIAEPLKRVFGRKGPAVGAPLTLGDTTDPTRDRVVALVQLQRADGTWAPGESLERGLGLKPAALRQQFEAALAAAGLAESGETRLAWATALACAWLELHAADLEDEWRMVAKKGLAAIDRAIPAAVRDAWRRAAHAAITA